MYREFFFVKEWLKFLWSYLIDHKGWVRDAPISKTPQVFHEVAPSDAPSFFHEDAPNRGVSYLPLD